MHLLLHIMGVDNLSGPWYGFWSGIGSDLSEFAILGIVWHKLNCHEAKCWRIGRHHQGERVVCRKHYRGNMAA